MLEERFLRELKREQDTLAHDALRTMLPTHSDYARLVGMHQGLSRAIAVLERLMRGSEED